MGLTLALLSFTYIVFEVGRFVGRYGTLPRDTRRDAEIVLTLLREGRADLAEQVGLLDPHSLAVIKDQERDLGTVHAFEITGVYTGAFIIPVVVDVKVHRSKGSTSELLIRHGGNSRLLVFHSQEASNP